MTTPRLSLDSLTLTDTQPQDVIRAAAAAGFDVCSLWIQAPALYPSPLLSPDKEKECAAILADTVIEVVALEVFDLYAKDCIEAYKPQLELGARLGGKVALTINYSNPDRSRSHLWRCGSAGSPSGSPGRRDEGACRCHRIDR